MLVAERAQAGHEILRRDIEAALALHRFDDDRGDVARLGVVLEDALDARDRVIDTDAMDRAGYCARKIPPGIRPMPAEYGATLPVRPRVIMVRP